MATQEPNVYAGLSVVIGGLMHARPRFFAKVMGELLFWVGEDKMLFGSDYGIWEPKWQIDGFLDWDYPDEEYSDYPRVNDATQAQDPRPERREAVRTSTCRRSSSCLLRLGLREQRRTRSWSKQHEQPGAGARRRWARSRPGAGRADHVAAVHELLRDRPGR